MNDLNPSLYSFKIYKLTPQMLVFVMMLALIVFQPSKKEEEESEKRSGKARELEKEEVCCFHLCIDAVIV